MSNNTPVHKVFAVATIAALLVLSSRSGWAMPTDGRAALSVFGVVEVNGERVIAGGTVFSNSTIRTEAGSEATLGLGGTGRVALSANSTVRLSFTDKTLDAQLDAGQVRFSTPNGVSVRLAIPGTLVLVDGTQATEFAVSNRDGVYEVSAARGAVELTSGSARRLLAADEAAVVGPSRNQQHFRNRKALAGLLVAIGGAIATAIWIVTHDSDRQKTNMTFGGTVIVPSG
jgi:ferric-dicitrate binding protein FerR (iron transport regulator)